MEALKNVNISNLLIKSAKDGKPLEGKVAIVTGAARNMGRSTAITLASLGARILVHYHSDGSLQEAQDTVNVIKEANGEAITMQADLKDIKQIKTLFSEAKSRFGRVDIVVNTAGIMLKKPFTDVKEEEYDQMFEVHAKASFFLLQEAARNLADNGRIINISTSLTAATTPFYAVYAGAKAATEQFTKTLAKEVGNRGITVNTIAPGPLNTSFFYPVEDDQTIEYLKHMSVQNRLGETDEITPVITFLASPDAGWITAQTIRVNGGML